MTSPRIPPKQTQGVATNQTSQLPEELGQVKTPSSTQQVKAPSAQQTSPAQKADTFDRVMQQQSDGVRQTDRAQRVGGESKPLDPTAQKLMHMAGSFAEDAVLQARDVFRQLQSLVQAPGK